MARSSWLASIRSYQRRRIRARSPAVRARQAGRAAAAAAMARRVSAAPIFGTMPTSLPSAGSNTPRVSPSSASTQAPSMQQWQDRGFRKKKKRAKPAFSSDAGSLRSLLHFVGRSRGSLLGMLLAMLLGLLGRGLFGRSGSRSGRRGGGGGHSSRRGGLGVGRLGGGGIGGEGRGGDERRGDQGKQQFGHGVLLRD